MRSLLFLITFTFFCTTSYSHVLISLLLDDKLNSGKVEFGLEHDGQCLLIKRDWKITNISDPFDESAFALYKLSDDMGETQDLSKTNPYKFGERMNEWIIFKKKVGVIPKGKGESFAVLPVAITCH